MSWLDLHALVAAGCGTAVASPVASWAAPGSSPSTRLRRVAGSPGWAVVAARAATRGVHVWLGALHRRAAAQRDQDGEELVELAAGFAAHLRTGADPLVALARSVAELPLPAGSRDLRRLAETVRLGGSAPPLLRAAAVRRPELRWLAAAWQVSERCGAALAPVVEEMVGALRAHSLHSRTVRAELAGVRTSARLLAVVPVVGLAMGAALGARPVGFLVGTDAGHVCLAGGLLLEWAGLRWSRSIADRARGAAGG